MPISATLSFGAQRAFGYLVEFLDGQLRTARVKNPWSPKTSVIVEEAMTLMARYNFSFVGSAVNGYLEGSLVFLDLNFNGLLDEDEPSPSPMRVVAIICPYPRTKVSPSI